MFDGIRYTRPVPESWPELTTHAEAVIPSDVPPGEHIKRRHLFRLFRRVQTLQTEELEANYYYGLGKIMCGMAGVLHHQHERDLVIQVAAEGLVNTALLRRKGEVPLNKPFVPLVGDLIPEAMEWSFYALAKMAWDGMPAPERALTDVLTAAVAYRRHKADGTLRRPHWLAYLASIEYSHDQRPAAYQIGCNSLESATSVLGVLLTGTNPKNGFTKQALSMPVDNDRLTAVKKSKIFINAARLRLDELYTGVGWEGEAETLHFDTNVLLSPPAPLDVQSRPGHLHERRLTCPAIQAGGLAHDVVQNIMPAVIATAQCIVPGELHGLSGDRRLAKSNHLK